MWKIILVFAVNRILEFNWRLLMSWDCVVLEKYLPRVKDFGR